MRYLRIENDNELALLNAFTRIRDREEITNFTYSKIYEKYLEYYSDILPYLKNNFESLECFKSSLYSYLMNNLNNADEEKRNKSRLKQFIDNCEFITNKEIPDLTYNFDKKDFLYKVLNEWGYYNLTEFQDDLFNTVRNKLIALAIPMRSQLSCIDFIDYETIEDLVSCTDSESFEKAKNEFINLYEFTKYDFFSTRRNVIMDRIIGSFPLLSSLDFWKYDTENRINSILKMCSFDSEILFVSGIDLELGNRLDYLNECKIILYSV